MSQYEPWVQIPSGEQEQGLPRPAYRTEAAVDAKHVSAGGGAETPPSRRKKGTWTLSKRDRQALLDTPASLELQLPPFGDFSDGGTVVEVGAHGHGERSNDDCGIAWLNKFEN